MSPAPERNPKPTVECFICGRENPIGRLFCQFCKQRIVAPPPDEFAFTDEPSQAGETHLLQVSLQGAQEENQKLRQQVESMQQELGTFRAAKVEHSPGLIAELQSRLKAAEEKAGAFASHAGNLETKWKSAEAKAVALEEKLVAKVKEVEQLFASTPGTNPSGRWKVISGIMAMAGMLGGYGTARYVQPKDDTAGKINQLTAQLASAKVRAGSWKSLLDSATAKADQIQDRAKADIDAANLKVSDLTARQEQLQRELKDATTEKSRANETIRQRDVEMAALSAQLAPRGVLVWKGIIPRKTTIGITGSSPTIGTLSGALPKRPFKVSSQDPQVKIRTHPSEKNHWSEFSFEVSGSGPVQVKIDWEVIQ